MATLAPTNFGPLIAYVIPGSGLLYCLRSVSEDIDKWFGTLNSDAPTIAGFLFVTLAAVAAGLLLSTVRWLVLDTLHHTTGIEKPKLEMQKLASATEAFRLIVEHKYKYYQFYGNSLVALLLGSPVVAVEKGCSVKSVGLLMVVATLLFLGSRNTLSGYYLESSRLLGEDASSSLQEASNSETEIP